jgi:hypothetical protein
MKKILFVLLLLILIKLLSIYKEKIVNQSYWNNYRLGDIIWGWIYLHDKKYYNNVKKRYPNSISDLYIKKTKNLKKDKKFWNYEVLDEIINKKKNELDFLPGKDDLVVHIRIGDALKNFKNGKYHFLRGKFHYYPEMYTKMLNKNFKKNTKKKVFILYGSHFNTQVNLSKRYIKDIEKIFKDYGFIVEHKNSGNPDKDYIFMANSFIFIRGGGGYSDVISKHVKFKGRKIINPKDYK